LTADDVARAIERLGFDDWMALAARRLFAPKEIGRRRRDERDRAIMHLAMTYPAEIDDAPLAERIVHDLAGAGDSPLNPRRQIVLRVLDLNAGKPIGADAIRRILAGVYRR
jgi:hypothetical protein